MVMKKRNEYIPHYKLLVLLNKSINIAYGGGNPMVLPLNSYATSFAFYIVCCFGTVWDGHGRSMPGRHRSPSRVQHKIKNHQKSRSTMKMTASYTSPAQCY